jgi:hypothetical protein
MIAADLQNIDRRQQVGDAIDVTISLVRNIILRRVLHSICPEPHLNFWRIIYGDMTDIIVLEWCKLFGSDDELTQPVHWKNLTEHVDQFRDVLFQNLAINSNRWAEYWREMKRYRDQSVAHHDQQRRGIEKYPTFDIALQSAKVYYRELAVEARKCGINRFPLDLEDYCGKFERQCTRVARRALAASKDVEEEVC